MQFSRTNDLEKKRIKIWILVLVVLYNAIIRTAHNFIHIPSELKTTCSTKLIMDFRIIVYLRKCTVDLCIFCRYNFFLLTLSNKSACKWWKEITNSIFFKRNRNSFLGKILEGTWRTIFNIDRWLVWQWNAWHLPTVRLILHLPTVRCTILYSFNPWQMNLNQEKIDFILKNFVFLSQIIFKSKKATNCFDLNITIKRWIWIWIKELENPLFRFMQIK